MRFHVCLSQFADVLWDGGQNASSAQSSQVPCPFIMTLREEDCFNFAAALVHLLIRFNLSIRYNMCDSAITQV